MFSKKYNQIERQEIANKIKQLYLDGFLVTEIQKKLDLKNKYFYTICNEFNISSPNKIIPFEATVEMIEQIKILFNEGASARQIAFKFKITDKIFERVCKKNNIINLKLSDADFLSESDVNKIIEIYNKGYGSSSIANQMNLTRTVIENILEKNNLQIKRDKIKTTKKGRVDILDKQICRDCKIEKPIAEFIRNIKKDDDEDYQYCSSDCFDCFKAKAKIANKKYGKSRKLTRLQKNKNNERHRNRRKEDPVFKLRQRCSSEIRRRLKLNDGSKSGESIIKYLQYSMGELKIYLESLFEPWMNWNNHGNYNTKTWNDNDPSTWTWQIDHIIPQAILPYDSMQHPNFKKAWALTNLRPYSAKQNIIDGTTKVRHIKT